MVDIGLNKAQESDLVGLTLATIIEGCIYSEPYKHELKPYIEVHHTGPFAESQ